MENSASRLEQLPGNGGNNVEVVVPASRTIAKSRGRIALFALCILAMLLTGIGWAAVSPPVSSPDDDYHLTSIWCPRPVEDSCESITVAGFTQVLVPKSTTGHAINCFVFQSNHSASCVKDIPDNLYVWSGRYDDGGYPVGYYRFHHLFVMDDVQASMVIMRSVNVIIAVLLSSIIYLAATPRMRRAMAMALVTAWFPMGIYFIASNNPTSWAITGVGCYIVAMYSATQTLGFRRWVLIGCGLISACLCLASRYDASFYLFVIATALLFAIRWNRSRVPEAVVLTCFAILGVWSMTHTSNNSSIPTGAGDQKFSFIKLVYGLLVSPKYFAGFYGYHWGPGWVDVPTGDSAPFVLSILTAGALVLIALRRVSWRKRMSLLMLIGAIVGLPAVFYATGVFDDINAYQARYILPLLVAVYFLLLAIDSDEKPLFNRSQHISYVIAIVAADTMMLYLTLKRFVDGIATSDHPVKETDTWWWTGSPFSPLTVFIIASVSAVVCVGISTYIARCPLPEVSEEPSTDLSYQR